MKILFIYLYVKLPQFPIGMGFLSSMLKTHGHESKLYALESRQSPEALLTPIRMWSPDVIAFSSMSSMFEQIKSISILIRRQFKDIFQVCGGIHPTLVPECIEEAPLDAICRGEGEYAFVELVERLSRGLDYTNIKGFGLSPTGNL